MNVLQAFTMHTAPAPTASSMHRCNYGRPFQKRFNVSSSQACLRMLNTHTDSLPLRTWLLQSLFKLAKADNITHHRQLWSPFLVSLASLLVADSNLISHSYAFLFQAPSTPTTSGQIVLRLKTHTHTHTIPN